MTVYWLVAFHCDRQSHRIDVKPFRAIYVSKSFSPKHVCPCPHLQPTLLRFAMLLLGLTWAPHPPSLGRRSSVCRSPQARIRGNARGFLPVHLHILRYKMPQKFN